MVNKSVRVNEKVKDDIDLLNTNTYPPRKYINLGAQKKSTSRTKEVEVTERLKTGSAVEEGQNKITQSNDGVTNRNNGILDSGNTKNTKQIEDQDIVEAENVLLFSTPDKGGKKNPFPSEELVQLKPQL